MSDAWQRKARRWAGPLSRRRVPETVLVLTAVLVALKLVDQIAVSWWVVLLPLELLYVVALAITLAAWTAARIQRRKR